MRIDADLVTPFLPSGSKIDQTEEVDNTDWSCDISIDGEEVFQMTWEWWEPGWSARRFAPSQAYVNPEHEASDESYVYSGEGAVTAVRCAEQGEKWDIFLAIRVRNSGFPNSDAMEKFIVAYRDEFLKSDPCADQ